MIRIIRLAVSGDRYRRAVMKILRPRPVILMEGLWLLRRPRLRNIFFLSIFIECPAETRLKRRLARDLESRGRSRASIRRQFFKTVEPMHKLYVVPQSRRAEIQLKTPVTAHQVHEIARMLTVKLNQQAR